MNKEERAKQAQRTIEVSTQGWYNFEGKRVSLNNEKNSELWTADMLQNLATAKEYQDTKASIYNASTVDTIFTLQKAMMDGSQIGVLNFASAYNPSGGFINGSMAQEEALAYASDLYFQQEGNQFYEINKKEKSKCYTDTAIYSQVTFFRDSYFNFVRTPYVVNVVTCPAVNMTALQNKGAAEKVMYERMRKVLCLFAEKGCSTVILGAWGCGVFGNDSKTIADNWYTLLQDEGYKKYFKQIIFSILDTGRGNTYAIFKDMVKSLER